jgi:hypothetical protein
MRFLTMCALGVLALGGAASAAAQPRPGDSIRQPSLFVSPMGQPFRANASGARGIDLWFTAADTDYDSRLSHDEFMANANAFFPLVDANHDGALTSLEDTAYWRQSAHEVVDGPAGGEPIGNMLVPPTQRDRNGGAHQVVQTSDVNIRGPRRGGPAERPVGAQAYGLLGDAEPIMSCDSNFDRRVTLAEFDACAERRFAMLDTNHDGFFTPDEAARYRAGGDVIRVSR